MSKPDYCYIDPSRTRLMDLLNGDVLEHPELLHEAAELIRTSQARLREARRLVIHSGLTQQMAAVGLIDRVEYDLGSRHDTD